MKTMKKKRKVVERDGKFYTVRGVELTRAHHTKTEAEFIAYILSGLARLTKYWPPTIAKLREGRRPNQSDNKKLKWENNCEACLGWFPESQIEVDHIIPKGGISGENWRDKVVPWLDRALIEIEGLQRLCKTCHTKKTNEERGRK